MPALSIIVPTFSEAGNVRELDVRIARNLGAEDWEILLDLFASAGRPLRYVEIPYVFRQRVSGESKVDSLAVWVAVHYAVLSTLCLSAGLPFAASQAIAAWAAMTSNFILNNLFTYRDRRLHGFALLRGLASFYLVCSLGALANIGVAAYAFFRNAQWALSAAAGILVGTLWNYLATARFTWRAGRVDGT